MTRRVNNSELKTFKRCRRRWWLSYYRRLELAEQKITGNLSIGNAVHQSLAAIELGESVEDALAGVREGYELKLEAHPEAMKELLSELELVRLMVEGFMEWSAEEGLLEDLEVYATEAELEYPLTIAGTDVVLNGHIDARVRRISTGGRLFREYKTAQDLARPGHTLQQDEQVLMYQLLEKLITTPDSLFAPVEGCLYVLLRKVKRTKSAKPPFYAQMEVRHGDAELRSFYRRTIRTIKDILFTEQLLAQGEDPVSTCYPTPTGECHWQCEWYPVCPFFDDGSDVEERIKMLYKEKEGGAGDSETEPSSDG